MSSPNNLTKLRLRNERKRLFLFCHFYSDFNKSIFIIDSTLSKFLSSEGDIPSYKNVMKALTGESSGRKSRKRKMFY